MGNAYMGRSASYGGAIIRLLFVLMDLTSSMLQIINLHLECTSRFDVTAGYDDLFL